MSGSVRDAMLPLLVFVVVVVVVDDFVVAHIQESKLGSVTEALERGSRHLHELEFGEGSSSLGQKLKASATKKVGSKMKDAKAKNPLKITIVMDAKAYWPQNVAGCSIQLLLERRSWCAYYPRAMPGSRSRTWGTTLTKLQVLRAVLQWAWAEHHRATGKDCPQNLESRCF